MRRTSVWHGMISVIIAVGLPGVVYATSGLFGVEFMVLGAVLGFAYWYWGPLAL